MAFAPPIPLADPTAPVFGPSPLLAALQSQGQQQSAAAPGFSFSLAPQQQLFSPLHPQQQPFSQHAPAALTAFVNKYNVLGPQLAAANLPPGVANALISFDADRARKGQSPLTDAQTTRVLQSAISGNATTPPKETAWYNLPVNAFHDVASIAASIPRLPLSLYHELQSLPALPDAISHALGAGNPLATIHELSQAPGLRLIPGAFTVGNLAAGDLGAIARHPVQTVLDVLPAAHEIGLGEKLMASPLGTGIDAARGELAATKMGQLGIQTFGSVNRQLSILQSNAAFRTASAMNPAIATADALEQATKDSVTWGRDLEKLVPDPARRRALTDMAERGNFDPANLSGPEISALERFREISDTYANHTAQQNLGTVFRMWQGSPEVFNRAEVRGLDSSTAALARYRAFTPVYTALRNGVDPATLPQIAESLRPYIADDAVSLARKQHLLRGLSYAYDAHSVSLPPGFRAVVNSGDVGGALDGLIQHPIEPVEAPRINQRTVNNWKAQNRKYTDAGLARREKLVELRTQRVTPARFQSLAEDALRSKVTSALTDRGYLTTDNPNFQAISDYLRDGRYRLMIDQGLISDTDLRQWQQDARQFAVDAKAAGVDPIFIHRVAPERVLSLEHPKPLSMLQRGAVSSPSQVRARTFDPTPYAHDLGIALTHQGVELINHRNVVHFLGELLRTTPREGEIVAPFARTEVQLRAQYAGVGRAAKIVNHALDADAAISSRIAKEWVQFDPTQLPAAVKDALGMDGSLGDLRPWLPRSVAKNMEMFIKPPEIAPAFGIPLKLFRVAVTGVSPRTHLYNIIGGATILTASTGPSVWRFLSDGRELMARIRAGDISDLPEGFVQSLGVQRDLERDWHPAAGTKLAEWWQQARAHPTVDAISRATSTVVDKSYELNGYFDDMYRAMAYLYGRDKALIADAGLSAEDAALAGENLSRKVLMQWDAQTPIERSILRPLLPFYGWISYIMRYAYRYPIDHPFRAAVTAAFARNELKDLGTGLPQTILNALFIGQPDIHGNVTAVQVGGMNPFRDVANYMTLGGFLSATNPIINTVLQQAGLQAGGGSNIYPNLVYDPNTGRLTASHPNFVANLIYNTIPQTRLLTGLLDRSSELHSLLARDPGAGGRLALSQAGIPILWRQYNLPQEQFKSELARESAQNTALHAALASGDWAGAAQFPGLRPVLGQIQNLQQSPSFAAKYDTSGALARMQAALAAAVG